MAETNLTERWFRPEPRFEAVIADWEDKPGGMALFYFNYSTWGSRRGLYLEDLYVRPVQNKRKCGRLIIHLAKIAVAEGCGRFQWVVHCNNASAVRLYESLGAKSLREWTLMSLKGEAIRQLAAIPLDGTTSVP